MAKILLTTDLSPESRSAFQLAKRYASLLNAEVTLLSVIEDPTQIAVLHAMDVPPIIDAEVYESIEKHVAAGLEEIRSKEFAGIPVTTKIVRSLGSIHNEIISLARDLKVDLIIMATHGRTGLSRLITGSVAERVVREAPCPVMIVPSK